MPPHRDHRLPRHTPIGPAPDRNDAGAGRLDVYRWGLRRAPQSRSPTGAAATDARPHDTDRSLADAVLGGDHEAFRALVEREAAAVLAVCRRVLGDPSEAEDAAQEAFVIAYRRLGTYRGDGPIGGWLMRIAVREARDRALRRRPTLTLDEAFDGRTPGTMTSAAGDPVATAESNERDSRLRSAIADLPAHYRDAVRMRYLDDRSFGEIAAATGRPEPTVRTHLHRGLAQLRARLGDEG